ncbi:MAG: HAMP domain-containing sensor histidine kinase [Candidatus Paceibacterota bacterium]
MISFTGLAILRYHLFEIKVILTEILVALMGITLMILIFFMPSVPLRLLTGSILFLFLIFGFLLIKATHEEVKRKEEAERLLKAKSEFLSIASHQLRTPLTAIAGYISMLKEGDYGRIPEEGDKAINKVYDSSQRMIKLVNDFLNVSRVETGRVVLNLSRVSLDEIILQIIAETELKVKQKGLFIKWNKPSLEPIVNVDPEKIKEAISNIVDNAIHYTDQGGITISAKIDPVKTTLMISDTGAGMDRIEIAKIFESFSRGSAGNKLYTQGSGLGLYIAKKFVELHGGRIWVESQGKGTGSAFYIELSNR